MVNLILAMRPFLDTLMKLAGLSPKEIKLGQDTVMNIWAPKQAKPDKPAVLLAHPFNGDGIMMWFPQVLALSGAYATYVPDFIFFGSSRTTLAECSTSFQCLGILEVQKCTVVGLSYGGMVGFKMAELYPNLVENLVVSSTVTELTRSISDKAFEELHVGSWVDLLLPENLDGIKKMFASGTHRVPFFQISFGKTFLRKEKAELLEATVVDDKNATTSINPQRIHFLWGDDDKIFSLELTQTMKENIGDKATLKWIKDAGHLLQLERPFSYNRELKKILASIYPNSK